MNIDYVKMQQSINEYAKYILNCIKNQYCLSLTPEQLQNIEDLLNTQFIVIEKPSNEDIEFFSKQAGIVDPSNYSTDYIPSAHGGRAKGDNKIHIYPYTKSFVLCKSNEEIIQSCIDNLVVHEIFHYFIRPYLYDGNDSIKAKFGHFITEGFVQYYAEMFAEKYRLGKPKSNYGKNVEFVKRLISMFPDNLTQDQINQIIFTYNQDEILGIAKNGELLYEEYVDDIQFKEEIASFITIMCIDMGMDRNDKKLKEIIRHYQKIDDVNIIFVDLSKNIELAFKNDTELRDNYMLKLKDLFANKKLKKDMSIYGEKTTSELNTKELTKADSKKAKH